MKSHESGKGTTRERHRDRGGGGREEMVMGSKMIKVCYMLI
jgi:hypothetical protein